ncbi:hypothetical protein F4703DRAFT_1919094 [Phycomyces blakesleeanus]|uniref:Uncharacterized protein n=1 Tax=Phycomyces blakesleeanus (strain ATCC 8743b / DSM 1359 / FGSC 10004 / NBRC 33097 / NRRL 1555) TaxID=763407 RepID=A0A167L4F1_PHYB8|nr:hypothetical protein PHYBLDRAFT_172211 [Phycomyces blakesleeanus NRRL 1555(-)]OAD69575.1 hypothetical protein PHYBLDRAFT_172211 [Phycomyces blakesleeanus NRRL 1555(-)]|eukprot:XP_018287615.1 hypothetical protein PHYBLDRAFT_172211 [Phycomyces blakesleeanus NRRL 1555(-)]
MWFDVKLSGVTVKELYLRQWVYATRHSKYRINCMIKYKAYFNMCGKLVADNISRFIIEFPKYSLFEFYSVFFLFSTAHNSVMVDQIIKSIFNRFFEYIRCSRRVPFSGSQDFLFIYIKNDGNTQQQPTMLYSIYQYFLSSE